MAYKFETLTSSNSSPRSNFADYTGNIDTIMIHHWGIDGQLHRRVVNWLRGSRGSTENRGSSAHYVTSSGLVTQLVAESLAAWGCVGSNGNVIHIECRPEMSSGDWATLVELCADIEERRGSMKYTRHRDRAATNCPGRYSSRIARLVRDINTEHKRRGNNPSNPRRKASSSKPVAKPSPAPRPATGGGYSGSSLVDYLKSIGTASNFASRARLARQHGISGYRGSSRQNTILLNKLRGGAAPKSSGKSVSTMADEVIRGDHGDGHAQRRRSLGVSSDVYKRVRAEVNRRYRN